MVKIARNDLLVKDGNIYINNQLEFLYGAEFHYFRVPKHLWRDRIKKIKEAGCNLVSTYIPWLWHEGEEGNFDFEGKTTPERDLIHFLSLIKEENLYCLVRPGPYIMSEIKNEGLPYWIYEKYPQVIAKKQNGENHPTRVVSYMHPDFIKKVDEWYKRVCEVLMPYQFTNDGPIIMFQLDNEVGMLHWVTGQGDYSDVTLDYFVKYLESKYSLKDIKEIFGTDNLEVIKLNVKNPNDEFSFALQNEYLNFMREYFKEYLIKLKSIAIKYGVEVPFVINIHGFDMVEYAKRGKNYPIGLSQLYKTAEIDDALIAGDYYIGNIVYENFTDIVLANAFTKAIQNKNQPLFSAEFQGGFQISKPRLQPSTFDLTTRLCIANGMNAINYYMFVGGENYENIGLLGRRHDWQAPIAMDGSLRRHYTTIQYIRKLIKPIERELLMSQPVTETHFGFYPDYYMTEYSNEFTHEVYSRIKHFREFFLFDGIARGLTLNNVPFEGYDLKKEEKIDPQKIKTLWVFSLEWMDEDVQAKLVDYIKNGGHLILYPCIPTKDLKGRECNILKNFINVEIKDKVYWNFANIDGIDSVSCGYIEIYEGENIKPFAHLDFDKEKCCAFEKDIDKGKIIVFGMGLELEHDFKREVIYKVTQRANILPITKKPKEHIDVWFRAVPGTDTKILFINNYDDYTKKEKVYYYDEELFDGQVITVNPRSGLMLLINYELNEKCKLIYSTCEMIGKSDDTITIAPKQQLEVLKFNYKVKVLDDVEHEIYKEDGFYKLIIRNSQDKQIKIYVG